MYVWCCVSTRFLYPLLQHCTWPSLNVHYCCSYFTISLCCQSAFSSHARMLPINFATRQPLVTAKQNLHPIPDSHLHAPSTRTHENNILALMCRFHYVLQAMVILRVRPSSQRTARTNATWRDWEGDRLPRQ